MLKDNLRKRVEKLEILEMFTSVTRVMLHNFPKVTRTPGQTSDLKQIENLWDKLDFRIRSSPGKLSAPVTNPHHKNGILK